MDSEQGEWSVVELLRIMEAAGYTHDVPREVSATEMYHRFVPPLGSRHPQIGVTVEDGKVRRKHVTEIKSILSRNKDTYGQAL